MSHFRSSKSGKQNIPDDQFSLSTIGIPKVVDLVGTKKAQYYTLWGVYAAVEWAASGYGSGRPLTLGVGLTVLTAVWLFNFGHLSFVLECIGEANKLSTALEAALNKDKVRYEESLYSALKETHQTGIFWTHFNKENRLKSHVTNTLVHLNIDTCASIALLVRINDEWIQNHLPVFMSPPPSFFE